MNQNFNIDNILTKAVDTDQKLTVDEAAFLFNCEDKNDVEKIKHAADILRSKISGNNVSYIVNSNVNFTNICEAVCLFCGFRRKESDPDSEILNLDELEEKLYNSVKNGASEVCLTGGLYSRLKIQGLKATNMLDLYAELLLWIKDKAPNIHLHAYSPEEIEYSSILSGKPVKYILEYFKDSGLDSMPGTAAEILADEIRSIICPKKLNTQRWVEIISQAHRLNIPTSATIMYGHIESNYHRARHLEILRNLQEVTGGITEFIPLPIITTKTLLSHKVKTLQPVDRLKMLAISRLFFKELIPNIQSSWVKQGIEEAVEALDWGVNDLGGTLGDEKITFAAGGNFGKNISKEKLISVISSTGKTPILRDTLYNYIENPVAVNLNC